MIINQASRQPMQVRLDELVNRFLPMVDVDPSFQRRVCWPLEQKQSYIINLLRQFESGTFAFADAKSGLERSIHDDDQVSISKYNEVLKAREKGLTSLDAQNRGETILDFYNDKFGITFNFKRSGKEYSLEDSKYSELPLEVKTFLDSLTMLVVVFNGFLYGDLNEIFLSINDGLPLVNQEKRNSMNTWISNELREKAENEYKDVFERVVKPDDILRMGDVELLLKVFVATHKVFKWTSTNKKALDNIYEIGISKTRGNVAEYHNSHMQRFYKIMDIVTSVMKAPKQSNLQKKSGQFPNQSFWAIVIIAQHIVDSNRTFKKNHGKDLDVIIYDLDKELEKQGRQNESAAEVLYDNGQGPKPESKAFYNSWVGLPHQKIHLEKRAKELTAEFDRLYSNILQTNLSTVSNNSNSRKVANG